MMFSFTSLGGKIDHSVNNGKGPYVFKMNGENYHRIGDIHPQEGETPKFLQLYIHDTVNEVTNRIKAHGYVILNCSHYLYDYTIRLISLLLYR